MWQEHARAQNQGFEMETSFWLTIVVVLFFRLSFEVLAEQIHAFFRRHDLGDQDDALLNHLEWTP